MDTPHLRKTLYLTSCLLVIMLVTLGGVYFCGAFQNTTGGTFQVSGISNLVVLVLFAGGVSAAAFFIGQLHGVLGSTIELRGRFETGTNKREGESDLEKRKKKHMETPSVSFHYANKDQIENFYNDYFKEPTVEKVVSEIASEISGSVEAKLPKVLESKAGGKNLSKWISDIKVPDLSLAGKFLKWQREMISNDRVSLGLDLAETDETDLIRFATVVAQLRREFDFEVQIADVVAKQNQLRKQAAEKTLLKLEKASGWVLVEGNFLISDANDGTYICSYRHPVSDYFGADEFTISVALEKEQLVPSIRGNYAQYIGRPIPLTIYGRVWSPIDRKSGVRDLRITPLAVY